MAATKPATGRPSGDVFLPAGASGGAAPQGKIMGMNRNTFIIVAVGVAVVAAYLIYRHYQNSASSSASTSDTGNIDPATGYPYGSAADLAALGAGPSGSGGSADTGTSTPVSGSDGGSNQGSSEIGDLLGIISQLQQGNSGQGNAGTTTVYYPVTTPAAAAAPITTTGSHTSVGGGAAPQSLPTKPLSGGSFSLPVTLPTDVGGSYNYGEGSLQPNIYGGVVPPVAANTPAPASSTAPYAVGSTSSSKGTSPANKTGLSANKTQGVFAVH